MLANPNSKESPVNQGSAEVEDEFELSLRPGGGPKEVKKKPSTPTKATLSPQSNSTSATSPSSPSTGSSLPPLSPNFIPNTTASTFTLDIEKRRYPRLWLLQFREKAAAPAESVKRWREEYLAEEQLQASSAPAAHSGSAGTGPAHPRPVGDASSSQPTTTPVPHTPPREGSSLSVQSPPGGSAAATAATEPNWRREQELKQKENELRWRKDQGQAPAGVRKSPQGNGNGSGSQHQKATPPKKPPPLFKREGTDKVLANVKGILNKITVETFQSMATQILLIIETADAELFKGIIRLIFDKVLVEPKFSTMYADLCQKISDQCPEKTSANGEKLKFRSLLLAMCQEQFEVKPEPEDEMKGAVTEEQREELERLKKIRILGNMQFIGALFKIKFLPEKIIHQCIQRLLNQIIKEKVEEDIEALCRLLTTVGADVDHPKAKQYIDTYFHRMEQLANDKNLPPRLRFMFMDLIDLRKKGWVSKRDEKQRLAASKAAAAAASVPLIDDDEPSHAFSTPTAPQAQPTPAVALARKPGGVLKTSVSGMQGGGVGGSSLSATPSGGSSASSSGYNSLRSSAAGGLVGESPRSVKFAQLPPPAPSRLRSTDSLPAMFSTSGASPVGHPVLSPPSGQSSTSSTPSSSPPRHLVTSPAKVSSPTSASSNGTDKFDYELNMLLDEYLSSLDLEEATRCVRELHSAYFDRLISRAVMFAMDKKQKNKDIVHLLSHLYKAGVLTHDHFTKAFGYIVEHLREIEIDVPKASETVAYFLAAALNETWISTKFLDSSLGALGKEKAALLTHATEEMAAALSAH